MFVTMISKVPSTVRNELAIALCCDSVGLKTCAADKPSWNEIIVPAVSSVLIRMRAIVPRKMPITASPATISMSPEALAGCAGKIEPSAEAIRPEKTKASRSR